MLVDMEWNITVSLVLRFHAECYGQEQETKFECVDGVGPVYKELASTVVVGLDLSVSRSLRV